MAAEAEAKMYGDKTDEAGTFLTDLMAKKQMSEGRRTPSHSAMKPKLS